MAIQGYVRPALEVYQNLQVMENSVAGMMQAVVMGPNYDVYQYGEDKLPATVFDSAGQTIPFEFTQNLQYDYAVDLSTVKVNAEGLEAELASWTDKFKLDAANSMIIRLQDNSLVASTNGAGLDAELHGMGVEVGDVVYVKGAAGDKSRRRTVVGVIGKTIPSVTGEGSASPFNTVPVGKVAPVLTGNNADIKPAATSNYSGSVSTTYMLKLVTAPADLTASWAGAQFSVTDSAGVDLSSVVTVNADGDVAIGTKGVVLTFAKNTANVGVAVGNVFSFPCVAASVSTTEFDGLLLDGMPVDMATFNRTGTINSVELRKPFTGEIPDDDAPDAAWTASEQGVTISPAASMFLSERTTEQVVPFADSVGYLYVSFRVLIIPPAYEDVFTISSTQEIEQNFGRIIPSNELAYGAACALAGSQGRSIFVIRTRGASLEDFTEAWKKSETNDNMYVFAPISKDEEVLRYIESLNESVSTPEIMRWRMTAIGADNPGEYVIADRDNEGNILKATISADPTGKYTLVQVDDDNEFSFNSVFYNGVGFQTYFGDKLVMFGQTYSIKRVLSAKEVELVTGPSTPVTVAQPIALVKADSTQNAVDYLSSLAVKYASRRAMLVWCDEAHDVDNNVVEGRFLAAYVAGLRSAMLPQQGMTMTEVTQVISAPKMYTKYTQKQLDTIASNGVMIITQDAKDGEAYIRHQLTTDTEHGSLYYEASVTSNVDNMSYHAKKVLKPYIGKTNVTVPTLTAIRIALNNLYIGFTAENDDDMVGAALSYFENLTVAQDPTFKDRVTAKVDLYVPLPLNNIKLYQSVFAATVVLDDTSAATVLNTSETLNS